MRTIQVVFYKEGRYWVAQALNVEVSSFGETREEARQAIKEALHLYFSDSDSEEMVQLSDAQVEAVTVDAL